jgi:hypothetical protein
VKLASFQEIEELVLQFVNSADTEPGVFGDVMRGLYYDPTVVEPDTYQYVSGVWLRVGEFRRLVGYSTETLKKDLLRHLVAERSRRAEPTPYVP